MNSVRKWNELLRHQRELHGWSQADLAEEVGTDQKVVSRWECGTSHPSPYFRKKLIDLFGKNAAARCVVSRLWRGAHHRRTTSLSQVPCFGGGCSCPPRVLEHRG